MPPIYTYENEEGQVVQVIRAMADIDVEPTEEEAGGRKGPWKRVISGGIQKRLSAKFGFGKGYHNSQTPNKRIP